MSQPSAARERLRSIIASIPPELAARAAASGHVHVSDILEKRTDVDDLSAESLLVPSQSLPIVDNPGFRVVMSSLLSIPLLEALSRGIPSPLHEETMRFLHDERTVRALREYPLAGEALLVLQDEALDRIAGERLLYAHGFATVADWSWCWELGAIPSDGKPFRARLLESDLAGHACALGQILAGMRFADQSNPGFRTVPAPVRNLSLPEDEIAWAEALMHGEGADTILSKLEAHSGELEGGWAWRQLAE